MTVIDTILPFHVDSEGGYFGRIYWINTDDISTRYHSSRIWGSVGWDENWPYSLMRLVRMSRLRVTIRQTHHAFAAMAAAAGEAAIAFTNYRVYYHKGDNDH
jgi:hypothetical protein